MPGRKLKSSPGLSFAIWRCSLGPHTASVRLLHVFQARKLWWGTKNNICCYFPESSAILCFKITSCGKSAKYQGAPSLMGNLELSPGSKCAQCCKWVDTTTPAHASWAIIATMTLLHTSQRPSDKYLSTNPAFQRTQSVGDVEKTMKTVKNLKEYCINI